MAGTLASVLLIFIVTIAAYALWLRVDQYGWTVDRIDTAAVTLVAFCFAIGYFIAALLPSPWLKLIETWNYLTTILGLVILLALFTPIADPMRLSVDSQMARLKSGTMKTEAFDFNYLRWEGGRFGRDALNNLTKSKEVRVSDAAQAALKESYRYSIVGSEKASPAEITTAITVYPKGKALPASFLRQDWSKDQFDDSMHMPVCMSGSNRSWRCDAVVQDFDGDGTDEVLLVRGNKQADDLWWNAELYRRDRETWRLIGSLVPPHCRGDREALLSGKFTLTTHPAPLPDIEIGGQRVIMIPQRPPVSCK